VSRDENGQMGRSFPPPKKKNWGGNVTVGHIYVRSTAMQPKNDMQRFFTKLTKT